MKKYFSKLFRLPDPFEIVTTQLRMAQLDLLNAQGAQEVAIGHVNVLQARVKRLQSAVDGYAKASDAGN